MNRLKASGLVLYVLLIGLSGASVDLILKVGGPKQVGQKTVVKLAMENTFRVKVESARAQVFLLDEKGKVVGQAVRRVIRSTEDRPGLAPEAEATFTFVVNADKPFKTTKVSFSRVVLAGGKLADVRQGVQVEAAK